MSKRLKVVQVVGYGPGNAPRRVGTLHLEDGSYVDLTEDDFGGRNYSATIILTAKESFCVLPENGGKLIISGTQADISKLK